MGAFAFGNRGLISAFHVGFLIKYWGKNKRRIKPVLMRFVKQNKRIAGFQAAFMAGVRQPENVMGLLAV